jgi:hypothetical protein
MIMGTLPQELHDRGRRLTKGNKSSRHLGCFDGLIRVETLRNSLQLAPGGPEQSEKLRKLRRLHRRTAHGTCRRFF